MVARLVSGFRTRLSQPVSAKPKHRDLSPRQAAMLMAKRPERLTEDQEGLLGKLTAASPEIAAMNTLMKGFSLLLRETVCCHIVHIPAFSRERHKRAVTTADHIGEYLPASLLRAVGTAPAVSLLAGSRISPKGQLRQRWNRWFATSLSR